MNFTERFNPDILYSIVKNEQKLRSKLYFIPDRTNDPFLLAKKILAKSEDGTIKVKHRQANNQGRRTAAGGISLANLARQLRHAVCSNIYIDIDMVNAHPVILAFICKQHSIDCDYLNEYVEDRDKLLSEFEDREAGKKAYLTVMNGADDVIDCIDDATRHLKRFSKEMKTIRNQLIKDKKRQYNEWKKYQTSKGRTDNFEGSFINSLMCDLEDKILMQIWDYFGKPKDAVLCFDGIMLDKEKKYDLEGCCQHIKDTIGIDINLKIKPMDEGFEVDEIIPYDGVPLSKIKGFDNQDPYVYNDFINEYCKNDREWEDQEELKDEILPKLKKIIAYLSVGKGFIVKKLDSSDHIMDMVPFQGSDLFLKFKLSDGSIVKLGDFIRSNSDVLSYSSTCCKPNPDDVDRHQFNFWPGFKAKMLNDDEEVDYKLIEPILHILKVVWADNDENVYKVLLYFFSEMLKNPEKLPNRENCILLIGDQGIGKDFIVNFFTDYVIGRNLVARLTGIDGAVGNFNGVLRSKVLCVINEMASTRETFMSNFDKVKPLISNETNMINQKGIEAYSVENISSWLMFSNHEDVLYLEKGDRRYKCLRGNPIYKGNGAFFKSVADRCFNKTAGNHMYTYLMRLTAADVLHPSQLKTTKLKEELKELSKNSVEKFIDEVLEYRSNNLAEDSELENELENELVSYDYRLHDKVSSKELYDSYKVWASNNNEKVVSMTRFGLTAGKFLDKTRTAKGTVYIFKK